MDHVIHAVVRSVGGTIAVTSELIAGQKGVQSSKARAETKAKKEERGLNTTHDEDDNEEQNMTEQAWELDEAGSDDCAEMETQTTSLRSEESIQVLNSGLDQHVVTENVDVPITPRPLPMAVILPQRRPRDRRRGFVRAYAPILGEYSGISQATFLNLLNTWNAASHASPIFDVINIACFGIGFIPNGIAAAVSAAVGTASMVAQELQGRYRSNTHLSKLNDEVFMPRGLVAMVMTYKPEMPDDMFLRADTSDPTSVALAKILDVQTASRLKRLLFNLRKTSGTSQGDAQVPNFAPLVYPSLDLKLASSSSSQELSVLRKNTAVVQDYLDRRAQADFIARNPESKIASALPPLEKPFVNRYCDPNHPVNSGSLFSLVTGGKLDPIGAGRVRRAKAAARRNGEADLSEQEIHDALMGRMVRNRVTGTPSKTLPVVGKMLKPDALYLVIVNMPTAEEVQRVELCMRV